MSEAPKKSEIIKCCGTCFFRREQQLPPPNIGKVGVCICMPPTPCVAFAQQGIQVGIVAQVAARPQVSENELCGQWQALDELNQSAANE